MKIIKNRRGTALVTALLVMFVLCLFGAALCHYSMNNFLLAVRNEKMMQAYYLARSGADAAAVWLMKNPDSVQSLIDAPKSNPVDMEIGTFEVDVSGRPERIEIQSIGKVDGVTDKVTVILEIKSKEPGELPDDVREIFPPDFDFDNEWESGSDEPGDLGWVDSNNGRVLEDGKAVNEDGEYLAVRFAQNIEVTHREAIGSKDEVSFEALYLFFENPETSLYIGQKRTLNLHAEIIVFNGKVIIQEAGINSGQLTLNIKDKSGNLIGSGGTSGAEIGGDADPGGIYGRVYFYEDVLDGKTKAEVIIEKGAYYFLDGLIIRGNKDLIPPEGLIPVTDNNGDTIIWKL